MRLTDNTILVTGGGTGIGRGLAESFLRLGNTVVIAGRTRATLERTAAEVTGLHVLELDVTDPGSIARAADELAERFPDLDVLVHNAGVMIPEDLTAGDVAIAERTVATNLLGPLRLTAALLPRLLERPRAAIVNVTSGLAFVPLVSTPSYCATKAALHSWTQTLRQQLEETAVDVHEIAPPYVRTHLTGAQQAADPNAMPLEEFVAEAMALLADDPEREEVLVERVRPLRFAERTGTFDERFRDLVAMARERAAGAT